jgi:NAD(P)-dependent dehydrogenase (short-subunit alcohol dehydrogenase family)
LKTAIITGGNGGLGRAFAHGLQAEGWHTVLLDIDVACLAANAQQTPIQLDLTDAQALSKAASGITAARPSIDLVIYNAGITQIGAFAETPDTTHRAVFEINYFAAVNLARAMAEPLRKSRGTHLAISSVAGFSPLWHRTAYAASKHALQGFFTSLRSEEAPFGVRTVIAAPSFVATNIGNAERRADGIARPGSASDGVDYMSPDAAAAVILRGLNKRRNFIPVGRVAHLSWWLNRLSPTLFQRLMERKIRR